MFVPKVSIKVISTNCEIQTGDNIKEDNNEYSCFDLDSPQTKTKDSSGVKSNNWLMINETNYGDSSFIDPNNFSLLDIDILGKSTSSPGIKAIKILRK